MYIYIEVIKNINLSFITNILNYISEYISI